MYYFINVTLLIRCSRHEWCKKERYVYQTYMTLNALNGSKIEVDCV